MCKTDMFSFFDNELFSDVTIVFEGRRVRAHKVVLASQSPYFHAMFSGTFQVSHPYMRAYKSP